ATGVALVVQSPLTYNYLIPIISPTRLLPASNFIYMTLWTLPMLKYGLEMAVTRGRLGRVPITQAILIRQIQKYQNPQMIQNQGLGLISINYLNRLMIN